MECNRDEALRAKEIAERKFNANDFIGAKKFIMKAQNLFPALEGVNQMLATLDVYIAGELKTNGEKDWYGILCVDASADEETLKKQYRKLALQLHPDKNKSLGAEGAFKLISQAWCVLSDKAKKFRYDLRRNVKEFPQRVPNSQKEPPFPAAAGNVFQTPTKSQRVPPFPAAAAAGNVFQTPTKSQRVPPFPAAAAGNVFQTPTKSQQVPPFPAAAGNVFQTPTKSQRESPFPAAAPFGFKIPGNSQREPPAPSAAPFGFKIPSNSQREPPAPTAAPFGFKIPSNSNREPPVPAAAPYGFKIPTNSQKEAPIPPPPAAASAYGFKIPAKSQKEPQVSISAANGFKIPTKLQKEAPIPPPPPPAAAAAYGFKIPAKSQKEPQVSTSAANGFKVPTNSQKEAPIPAAAAAGGFKVSTNKTAAGAKVPRGRPVNKRSASAAAPPSSQLKVGTFWTSCPFCKMLFEFAKMYLNRSLVCPSCKKAFKATETDGPTNGINRTPLTPDLENSQHDTNKNNPVDATCGQGTNANNVRGMGAKEDRCKTKYGVQPNETYSCSTFFRQAGGANANANASSAAAQAAGKIDQTREKILRKREEALAALRKEVALKREKKALKRAHSSSKNVNVGVGGNLDEQDRMGKRRRTITADLETNFGGGNTKQAVQGTGKGGSSVSRFKMTYNANKETSKLEIRGVLIEKAKFGIKEKLVEWNLIGKEKGKQNQKPEDTSAKWAETDKGKQSVASEFGNSTDAIMDDGLENIFKEVPDSDYRATGMVSIDVPDPDFYNFDGDRSENSFRGDEIWAVYDTEDGMPRFYALVQKVVSVEPFEIRIAFLNSKTNGEFGPLNWVGSGFAKTCGDFRVGKYGISDTVNIFSHRVRWEKGVRGVIKIVPKKGDTWALYKNWSPNWNEHTAEDVIYKYEMVEVLDDYNEEQGVSIIPLLKVAGFKTVFHRHLDPKKVRRIPKEQMFRFSHQVPAYVLTGEEADNAPTGCLELDPAATPMELLKVITEAKEDEVIEADELNLVNRS